MDAFFGLLSNLQLNRFECSVNFSWKKRSNCFQIKIIDGSNESFRRKRKKSVICYNKVFHVFLFLRFSFQLIQIRFMFFMWISSLFTTFTFFTFRFTTISVFLKESQHHHQESFSNSFEYFQ